VSDLPILPLWVTKYEGKCAHLTLEEDGAHTRLLRLCWQTPGCTIPTDPVWIARRMRVDLPTYERVVGPILAEFFVVANGRWQSLRLLAEYERATRKTDARKQAGAKGGKAKALKTGKSQPSNATVLPEQTLSKTLPSTISISTEEKEEAKASSKKTAQKTRLADDWALPRDWVADAFAVAAKAKQTITELEIENESDGFRDYSHSKSVKHENWRAAWRNWIRNYIKWRKPGHAPGRDGPRANGQHGVSSIADAAIRRHFARQNGNGVSDDRRGDDLSPAGNVIDAQFSLLK